MGGPGTARSGASRTPAQVGRGEFVIPGFAKMSVVNKPATEARSGVNPFTKEPMEFAAKPASKSVKASLLKVAKTLFEAEGLVGACSFV